VRLRRAAFAIALALLPIQASAHEKWFIDAARYPLRWDLFFSSGPFICTIAVAVITAALAFVWRARDGRDFLPSPEYFGATPEGLRIVYALLPLIIGVHVAIPLFYDGLNGTLF